MRCFRSKYINFATFSRVSLPTFILWFCSASGEYI